jgi:hypothetical protein
MTQANQGLGIPERWRTDKEQNINSSFAVAVEAH